MWDYSNRLLFSLFLKQRQWKLPEMKRVVICSSLNFEGQMHTKPVELDDESNSHLAKAKNTV